MTDTEALIERLRAAAAETRSLLKSEWTRPLFSEAAAALATEKERADAARQDQRAFDDYREQYLQLCLRLEAAEAQVAALRNENALLLKRLDQTDKD